MAKILLVEDDNNLREIYEARLQAEGYEIVSARDGEEALTVAMKERPDLIISDVMMPKISGFDMLDIIRSTEETKNVKVIMMTALSQAEDKARAEKLGADRYLVKSQVTLEDVAKVAREVLSGESPAPTPAVPTIASPAPAPVVSTVAPESTVVTPPPTATVPVVTPMPAVTPTPVEPTALSAISPVAQNDSSIPAPITPPTTDDKGSSDDDEQSAIAKQIESFIDSKKEDSTPQATSTLNQASPMVAPTNPQTSPTMPPITPAPVSPLPPVVQSTPEMPDVGNNSSEKKVIEPIVNDAVALPDLNDLLKKEEEKEKMAEVARQIVEENNTPPPAIAIDAANPQGNSEPVHPEPAAEENSNPEPVAISSPTNTGTNIDGVIPQPPASPPQNDLPADDPNNITL